MTGDRAPALVAIALLAGVACVALAIGTRPAAGQGDQWQLLLNRQAAPAPVKRKVIRGYIRKRKPAIAAPRRPRPAIARAVAPAAAAPVIVSPIVPVEVRTITIAPPHRGAFVLRSPADDPAPAEDLRPPLVPAPLVPFRDRPSTKTAVALAMAAALILSVLYPINGRA